MAGANNSDYHLSGRSGLDSVGSDNRLGALMGDERIECQGCGMMIGRGYMEQQVYKIGGYKICGQCLEQMKTRGRLWVQPYNANLYLHPDGRVVQAKLRMGRSDVDTKEEAS